MASNSVLLSDFSVNSKSKLQGLYTPELSHKKGNCLTNTYCRIISYFRKRTVVILVRFYALEPCLILISIEKNLQLITQYGVFPITVFHFGHHKLLNMIGLSHLKASHLREGKCCSRKRHLGMSCLHSYFGSTIYQMVDHGQVQNL